MDTVAQLKTQMDAGWCFAAKAPTALARTMPIRNIGTTDTATAFRSSSAVAKPAFAVLLGLFAGQSLAQDNAPFTDSISRIAERNLDSESCARKVRSQEGDKTVYGLPKRIYNWKFMWENDVGISDRDYTNGMKFERYLYPECLFGLGRLGFAAAWLHDAIPDGPNKGQELRPTLGYSFGMNFYTPGNLEEPMLQPADRPYSGWAYVSLISHRQYSNDTPTPAGTAKLETMFGVLGDWAQQDHVQEAFHELIDSTDPQGWHNQHSGTVGVNIAYERKHYFYAGRDHVQFMLGYGGNLGNVRTDVSGAVGIAYTFNPDSWAYLDTATIGPTKRSVAAAANSPDRLKNLTTAESQAAREADLSAERLTVEEMQFFTLSLRAEPRYKGYDFFLDENPSTGLSTYEVERYVYDAVFSLDFKVLPKIIMGLRSVYRSQEIDSPFGEEHRFVQFMLRKYF